MSFDWQNLQARLQDMFQASWHYGFDSVSGKAHSTGNPSTATSVNNDREPLSDSSLISVILRFTEKPRNGSGGYSINWMHGRDEEVHLIRRTQAAYEGSNACVRNYISNNSVSRDRKKQSVPRFSGYASPFDCLLRRGTSSFTAETSPKTDECTKVTKYCKKVMLKLVTLVVLPQSSKKSNECCTSCAGCRFSRCDPSTGCLPHGRNQVGLLVTPLYP